MGSEREGMGRKGGKGKGREVGTGPPIGEGRS